MRKVRYIEVGDGYEAVGSYTYTSPRYGKSITVRDGFYSDGATFARDLDSDSWWVHDVICRYGKWDDGTLVTRWQAAVVLYDILKEEGYVLEDFWWAVATYLFGGGAARRNKEEITQ